MTRKDFWTKMRSIYPKSPDDQGLKEFNDRLSKWRVSNKQIDRLYEHLSEKCQFFPTIAEFAESCQELGLGEQKRKIHVYYQAFTWQGADYFRVIQDPERPPTLPDGACNVRLIIPPARAYSDSPSATGQEAQEAFREGYLAAGGNPKLLPDMRRAIRAAERVVDDDIPF